MLSKDWSKELLIPAVFFLIFTSLICWDIIFRNQVLFTGDNFDLLFPQKEFLVQEIRGGRVPLWNPYILSGTPYLADINLGTLSLTNLIYFFIKPVARAGSYLFAIEFFLIGFFTYLSARHYKLSRLSASISGLVFMCSGIVFSYIMNLAIFNVVVFLPLLVFVLEKAIEKNSFRLVLLCAVLFALQIISGHVQITFYTGLLLIVLVLLKKRLAFLTKIKILMIVFLLGLGIAAIQVVPSLELVKWTPRINQGFAWATQGSLGFTDLLKFAIPKFAWNFTGWVDFSAKINLGYIGVVPLILLLVSFFAKGKIWKNFFLISLVVILLSLGRNTFLYRLVYLFLPGIAWLKNPSQLIVIYSFTAALLSGKGLDLLSEKIKQIRLSKQNNLIFLRTGLFVSFFLFILAFYLINNISFLQIPGKTFTQSFKVFMWIINGFYLMLFSFLFLVSFSLLRLKKIFWGRTLIFSLIILDLFLSAKAVLITSSQEALISPGNVNQVLAKEKTDYKIYTIPPEQIPKEKVFSPAVEREFARQKKDFLLPNQNISDGLVALDGYASMAISRYINQFTDASKTVTGLGRLDPLSINYSNWGVRYLISQNRIPSLEEKRGIILVKSGQPVIYELINSRKRYYLEKEGRVELIDSNPQKIIFETASSTDNRLIFLENDYPGWQAYIDNQEIQIELFEDVFKSVSIPSGYHLIRFEFAPKSVTYGLVLSFVTLVTVLILAFKGPKKI